MTTINEIKARLAAEPTEAELVEWSQDSRVGVQKLLTSYHKQQLKLEAQRLAFEKRLVFERAAWQQGTVLAGIDEVGRGPLAGPVVAAAVVIDEHFDLIEVHDSKQLTEPKRRALAEKIKQQAVAYAYGIVDAPTIDEINIYEAARVAMKQALTGLAVPVDGLLVDAMVVDSPLPQEKLIKGDDRSISIGAASVIAKVFRDELMAAYALEYPGYGFEHNAGYGTAEHLAGLATHGITPIHRHSFAPVKAYLK